MASRRTEAQLEQDALIDYLFERIHQLKLMEQFVRNAEQRLHRIRYTINRHEPWKTDRSALVRAWIEAQEGLIELPGHLRDFPKIDDLGVVLEKEAS